MAVTPEKARWKVTQSEGLSSSGSDEGDERQHEDLSQAHLRRMVTVLELSTPILLLFLYQPTTLNQQLQDQSCSLYAAVLGAHPCHRRRCKVQHCLCERQVVGAQPGVQSSKQPAVNRERGAVAARLSLLVRPQGGVVVSGWRAARRTEQQLNL